MYNLDVRAAAGARRSAREEPWEVAILRPLVVEDLVQLQTLAGDPPENPRAPLSRIRDPHHMLAKLLADGTSVVEASAIVGYSTSRIYTLKADPAFKELLSHYEAKTLAVEADIHAQIKHASLTALSVLQERLETCPEDFSQKDLRDIAYNGLDRIGHGPSSTHNVNLNDPKGVLLQIKTALEQEIQTRILSKSDALLEVEYTEVLPNVQAEAGPGAAES